MRSLKLAAGLSASDVFMYHCLQGKKPMTDRVGQRGAPEIAQVSAVR